MKTNRQMNKFLIDSSKFIDEFRPSFVKYFVDLCMSYDKFYSYETLEDVANIIYKDIFEADIFLVSSEKDIFEVLRKDGVMIGFLISRSMFFLLENYMKKTSDNQKCEGHIESMVLCVNEYIKQFEKNVCNQNKLQTLHVNFDTSDNFLSQDNIPNVFKDIKNRGKEVTFFNLYKGVPIQYKASIANVYEENVVFKVIQTQAVAIKMDGAAYILKDENFNKCLKADLAYSDFLNNTVVLRNFSTLLNMPAVSRKSIRVHPEIMVKVSLLNNEKLSTSGKLFDLSIDGLGVISEKNNGIYAGAKININFSLDGEKDIETRGEVLNIIEYSNSYRYCIKSYPKEEIKKEINNYVQSREVEILNDLSKRSVLEEEWQ